MKKLNINGLLNESDEDFEKKMFKKTQWNGLSYKRIGDWSLDGSPVKDGLTSPIFIFENGDVVAVDINGEFVDAKKHLLK